MTKIELKLIDGTEISKTLSWGVHKELVNYLMEDGRLMTLFTDNNVTESVLQICLAKRDSLGGIVEPFTKTNLLDTISMLKFLEELYDYFENFFFLNQQRVVKLEKKFQELQTTNQ